MNHTRRLSFRLSLAAIVLAAAPAPAAQPLQTGLGQHLRPCTQGHSRVPARCGTFGVYEDRAARSGRIIQPRMVVIDAKHAGNRAIAMIAGGPGESAAGFAPDIADGAFGKEVAALRDTYNVLFLDVRGTGGSNPTRCILTPPADPATYFAQLFPSALLAACRKSYSAVANPNFYNTQKAVDDLDDVRAALGYPKLVLDGGSYGTYVSLVYIRRHPGHVESAVLNSASPPGFNALPGEPQGAQTAFDDLVKKCARDPICGARFPRFAQHFAALLERFRGDDVPGGGFTVQLKRTKPKRLQTLRLSKEVFVDTIRHILYDPGAAAYLPYAVERAHAGDTQPLAAMMNDASIGLDLSLDMGAFFSYSCAEQMPFLSAAKERAAAAGTFGGDLRMEAQRHACAIWNVAPVPAAFNDPVRSDAPIFFISGSDDPATPPHYTTAALRYLPNARQVVVRGAGHTPETPCIDALIVAFVHAQSAKNLNLAKCEAAPFALPAFKTSMAGWP